MIEILISMPPVSGSGPASGLPLQSIQGKSRYSFSNIIFREDMGDVKETRTTESPAICYNSGFLSRWVDLREVFTFSHFFHHLKCPLECD